MGIKLAFMMINTDELNGVFEDSLPHNILSEHFFNLRESFSILWF